MTPEAVSQATNGCAAQHSDQISILQFKNCQPFSEFTIWRKSGLAPRYCMNMPFGDQAPMPACLPSALNHRFSRLSLCSSGFRLRCRTRWLGKAPAFQWSPYLRDTSAPPTDKSQEEIALT